MTQGPANASVDADGQLGDRLEARTVVREETAFAGRVFDVVSRVVDLGEAGEVTREHVRHPGAVAVVALDAQDRVALIRQYRVPVGAWMWEVPAGLLDGGPGETLQAAAARELAEEVGLAARRWDVLVDYATSPGMTDEVLRVFLAQDLHEAPDLGFTREGEEAEIELHWVPVPEAVRAVLEGRVHNPSAVAGLLALAALRAADAGPRPTDAPWALRPDVPPV